MERANAPHGGGAQADQAATHGGGGRQQREVFGLPLHAPCRRSAHRKVPPKAKPGGPPADHGGSLGGQRPPRSRLSGSGERAPLRGPALFMMASGTSRSLFAFLSAPPARPSSSKRRSSSRGDTPQVGRPGGGTYLLPWDPAARHLGVRLPLVVSELERLEVPAQHLGPRTGAEVDPIVAVEVIPGSWRSSTAPRPRPSAGSATPHGRGPVRPGGRRTASPTAPPGAASPGRPRSALPGKPRTQASVPDATPPAATGRPAPSHSHRTHSSHSPRGHWQ